MAEGEKPATHWRLKWHWPHSHHHEASHHAKVAHQPPKAKHEWTDFTKNIPFNLPYPPFINIEGVPNFRDLGGYTCVVPTASPPAAGPPDNDEPALPAATAAHVRPGFAFRCSELSQLTLQANQHMLKELRIATVFDLRSEREAARMLGHPRGVDCVSTPVYRRQDLTRAIAIEQLRWATAADAPADAGFSQGYVDWYRQIAVFGARYAYRVVFEHVRDYPERPFVYHCSAGKDRTGVLSALLLKLCGVDDATVAWEYALTVPGMGVWEAALEQEMVGDSMLPIRDHGGMTLDEAHRVCGSRASNMRRWLEVVLEGEFGGAAMYLRDYARFPEEDVAKIVKNLTLPGEGSVGVVEVEGMEDHPQT